MKNGISFTVELAAADDYIPYQEEIMDLSIKEFGALPHITILRDDRKRRTRSFYQNIIWKN
ncbi:MAG: hypothetical protein L6V78_02650 [Clostridium sp.]|nr:MAG: hypothetical protein L6V78_02650 [Clostridium sp.]